MGTSKPSVVDTKVSQIAGSKASFADVGLMVQSHERGFQKSSRALALSACSSNPFISISDGTWGLCDRLCLVLVCRGRYGLGGVLLFNRWMMYTDPVRSQ